MRYDYDLIVLGGGAAGLTAAGMAVNLGARTLLVERARLGGDCTWTGCVPSKALLKAARVAHQIRHAGHYGLADQPLHVDFAGVMAHVRALREEVYDDADRPERFEAMGVEVRHGHARFVNAHTVAIDGGTGPDRVSARRFVLCTGATAAVPPVEGLDQVPFLTNETLFEIDALPAHVAVMGGGPVGTEMAQALRRLGASVTVVEQAERILPRDDAELAGRLQAGLTAEGVRLLTGASVVRASQSGAGLALEVVQGGTRSTVAADALLVATGRKPNLAGLGLEAAGVACTARGVTVDRRCRTNVRHIYAAGDVTGRYQFTHMSEHMAKVAVTNAILRLPARLDEKHVPWVTYTDPELAHVGTTAEALTARGVTYRVYHFPYRKVDRAVTDGETTGLIKVYAKPLTGRILGASILGARAGELVCEYALAMRHGLTLRNVADTIHPYPTYGLGARRAADQWYFQKYSPTYVRLLQTLFRYRGPVNHYPPDAVI